MPRPAKHERSIAMYETILNLHTVEECVNFFEDLCAATELSAMEQRFDVASLLLEGRVYTEIMDTTKAKEQLGWQPRYTGLEALQATLDAG